jgi:diguanylate cyclase (GGDEF)-like protein/PAS domain S-box-containing protein
MSTKDNVIRLILAEDSLNDAEQLISTLRNRGLAVRPTRVVDDEQLQAALTEHVQDLLLCAPGLEGLSVELALRVLEQSGKDVPVLVLNDREDHELRTEVMTLGAVDLVSKQSPEHFVLTVQREARRLRERRRLRRLEAQLRETERRCHTLLDSSRDAVAYVHEGMHVYANASYLERFGAGSFEDLEGLPILDLVIGDDQARFKEFLRGYSRGRLERSEIELTVAGAHGEARAVTMEFSPASWDGEPCTQVLIREQSPGVDLEAQLAAIGRRDMLTGLLNRAAFVEELEHCITASLGSDSGAQSALLYLQPDNVDAIQENLGLSAVEQVMADMAEIVRGQVGDDQVAGRYAEHVVAVLLRDCGVHEALGLAEAIRSGIEAHVSEHDGRTITKSCSIGVAMLSDAISQTGQAFNLAHEACDIARREGGDRVHLYAAAAEPDSGGSWQTRLEDALAGQGFQLLFRPLVALAGDQEARYEVRLRLAGEGGALLAPRDFMPHAERLGLAAAVDRWVLDQVLGRLARAQRQGRRSSVFVKLGGATLADAEFAATLGGLLERHGIAGDQLILQINEPVAVTQLNDAKVLFKAAKEHRCGFALDQFGSGLNPFQLVKHLPADYLKLDRTLTEDLATSEDNRETVGSLIQTAHEMRKKVIAGYLQEATVLATLWQYQVDLVQGDFLGEALPEMNYDFSGLVI